MRQHSASAVLLLLLFTGVVGAQDNNAIATNLSVIPTEIHEADLRLFDSYGSENLSREADRLGSASARLDRKEPLFPKENETPERAVDEMLCSADAAVVALVKWPHPSFSRRETWVFTEYEMKVTSVIKDNVAHPIKLGQEIIVARSGGEIKTPKGKPVRVEDASFPPFQMGRYLILLHYLPESGQYVTSDPRGAFRAFGPRLRPLVDDKTLLDLGRKYSPETLTRAAKETSCTGRTH